MKEKVHQTFSSEPLSGWLAVTPLPVLFNPWKHHLPFLYAMVLLALERGEELLTNNMVQMGHSVTDVYEGNLTPQAIASHIYSTLKKQGLDHERNYQDWLRQEQTHYRTITLSDQSQWTLLEGHSEKYIHIHPSRYSPLSFRVKSLTLQSAVWVLYEMKKLPRELALKDEDIPFVNAIRKKRLQASPLHTNMTIGNLKKVMERFRKIQ